MTPEDRLSGMDARIRPVERRDAFSLAALRIQHDRELGRPPRPGFITEYADAKNAPKYAK